MQSIVLGVALVPLLLGGCGLLGFLYVRGEVGYDEAVERATQDARVQALLGAPVTASFGFSGRAQTKDGTGRTQMSIGLSGSKQNGTLLSAGIQSGGAWGFSRLDVVADDGKRISLVKQ